jgi:hypothetical protein
MWTHIAGRIYNPEYFSFYIDFTITEIPRKKALILLYSITIICGWLFFIGPIKNTKIVAFVLLGVIRFFFSIFLLIQRVLIQY